MGQRLVLSQAGYDAATPGPLTSSQFLFAWTGGGFELPQIVTATLTTTRSARFVTLGTKALAAEVTCAKPTANLTDGVFLKSASYGS